MTNSRRQVVTFGACFILVGASVLLLSLVLAVLNPSSSRAAEEIPLPTPVGLEMSVPVIVVPPPPTVSAIVPVGASADLAQVDVVVSGLLPYSHYELYLHSTPVLVASGFADSTGTFKVTISLPKTLVAGAHSLEVKGTDGGGRAYTKTVSQFVITSDRLLAGAGPGSSLLPTTSSSMGSTPTVNSSTQTTQTNPAAAVAALGTSPTDIGGILFTSGVATTTQPSFSPQGGGAVLAFTVKNVSHTTFDSSLDFWITSPVGDTITRLDQISVAGLASGETRTISASMIHVGQWPVLVAHVTITPPASVEKTQLVPLSRDGIVFTWPLFALIIAGLMALGYLLWRYVPLMNPASRAARRNDPTILAEAEPIVRDESRDVAGATTPDEPRMIVADPVAVVPEAVVPVAVLPEELVVPTSVPPAVKKPAPRTPRKPPAAPVVPTEDLPIIEKPALRKPIADKPAVPRPVADKPAVRKPAVRKPAADKPVGGEPVADKPKPRPKPKPKPQPENNEGGDS